MVVAQSRHYDPYVINHATFSLEISLKSADGRRYIEVDCETGAMVYKGGL